MNWIACLGFLKRSIEVVDGVTRIKVNPKYIDGLVSLLENIRRRRTPCDLIINNLPLESEDEVKLYRSCVGTLLYVSQYLIKELAAKLQSPTQGAMATMRNLVGYMHAINQFLGSMGRRSGSWRWQQIPIGMDRKKRDHLPLAAWLVLVVCGCMVTRGRKSTSC